jgi:serine protease AprX
MKSLFHFSFLFLFLLVSGKLLPQAEVDTELLEALQNTNLPVAAVVTFNGNSAPTESHVALLSQVGITKGFTFQSLPIAGVLITTAQVEALASNPEVRSVFLNKQLKYDNYNSTGLTGVDRLRSDPIITSKNGGLPVSGKGIGLLVNDSGVDATHNDLKFGTHVVQNALGSTNPHAYDALLPIAYVENVPNTDNNSGHGTHVAGSAGGTGVQSAGKYEGVAPGADLIGYGSGAVLLVLDAVGGFDYALTHQYEYNIRIITNSWGTSGTFSPNDPVNIASKMAYDRNIIVLFSAGNSGPGEGTITPYSAPWVVTVAAGDRFGEIADFSSRGTKNQTISFSLNGQNWVWKSEPTITGPGVNVISTRAPSPVPLLGDDSEIETQYLPFYTNMSGTSMSCPHVAGIVALMLDANPSLTPLQVRQIIQQTATNMPGHESWEVGAGYVNVYAAVAQIMGVSGFGATVNTFRTFNSKLNSNVTILPFTIDYYTLPELSPTQNQWSFNVPSGITGLGAAVNAYGLIGEGNTINLVLISPDGTEYSSGVNLLFALYPDRTVAVANPIPGNWIVELRGLRGDPINPTDGAASPEIINGIVKFTQVLGYTGLSDIAGHPAEASIKLAINNRLADGFSNGKFKPNDYLTRFQLADYLVMGQAIRQFKPTNGSVSFGDVNSSQRLIVESVAAFGSALRDRFYEFKGVMLPTGSNKFSPNAYVNRFSLAYSMVQCLGLEAEALALNGHQVTVNYAGQDIPIEDANQIPQGFEGYVQVALNLNLINAYYTVKQGPFDLQPTVHATFKPLQSVTRGEFAVIATRTHDQWVPPVPKENSGVENFPKVYSLDQNYPNPFNPSTTINFSVPVDGFVTIDIFNSLGEKVKTLINEVKTAGSYSVNFDAGGLASGIYIYKITSGNFVKAMKMNLLK